MQADGSKIQAMVEWLIPRNVIELRGFLGLTGYCLRFVKEYGVIAAPLTQLLHKNAFMWSKTTIKAFNKLKRAMVTILILGLPSFSKTFIIETDANCLNVREPNQYMNAN